MPKRSSDRSLGDGDQAYLKRQKIKHVPSLAEEIHSARQLQQLLAFDQDIGRARHGIQSFKVFLEAFAEEDGRISRLPILREYLQSQMPHDENDTSAVYLGDIMQTWSFASQSNQDSLLSSVPAVLALLLRTLSGILECAALGIRLGRTVLQKRQLELLARGLTTNKTKDFVISPNLRLIREVATFDGGALAKEVFRARDSTLKALARNLGLRSAEHGVEDARRPSIRTHALQLFLACIKFLPVEAKRELLTQRDVPTAITRGIAGDPPFAVREVLDGLKISVLQDEKLPREAKHKFLNAANLGRIATLYGYEQDDEQLMEGTKSINALVHEFLLLACTSPDLGVLNRQTGFYPRGVDPDGTTDLDDTSFIDLGIESLEWAGKLTENVPVRNTILSEFIQTLRPWSDVRQSELVLEIFKVAPELIADYFFGKKSFSFEPKLTPTWIGYSALVFSAISLPVPAYFGHQFRYARLPPPTSIVIESILPIPLTQKVLTRCLNQKAPLINFFAIRLLVVAFEKLKDALRRYNEASQTGSSLWDQAAIQLTEEFCRRCPVMKDVLVNFSNIPDAELLQRQAGSNLLVLYYEVVPQIALESKFDVSNPLAQVLRQLEQDDVSSKDHAVRVLEAESLFQIAHYSPGMRWFNKTESLSLSPFTAMLRLSAQSSSEVPMVKMRQILDSVIRENGIMQSRTERSAQDALIAALRAKNGQGDAGAVYGFIDNCLLRCSATPVKYIDMLEQYQAREHGAGGQVDELERQPFSLLLVAIAEQWPFLAKSLESGTLEDVARFIANYVAASLKIGEDEDVMKAVVKDLIAGSPENSPVRRTIERSRKLVDKIVLSDVPVPSSITEGVGDEAPHGEEAVELTMIDALEIPSDDHSALTKWSTREIEEIIEEGYASALITLLSSPHLEIRKEALSNIAKLTTRLHSSSYAERDQIWLLLSELSETAQPHLDYGPLPHLLTAFASHALSILTDPLHAVYPKINHFLSQGPTWALDQLPLLHRILHEPPSADDGHYAEISFLLAYLHAGLRTEADMALLHRRRVCEGLLGLYANVYLGAGLRGRILAFLGRATAVPGGSTTLVTRFSILSWLRAQLDCEGGGGGAGGEGGMARCRSLRALMRRILATCDAVRLREWSGRSVYDFLVDIEL